MNVEEAVATPVIVKATNAVTYAAAGGAFDFGLSANEVGMIASFLLGCCALGVGQWINYHFKQKHYRLVEKYVLSGQVDRRKADETRRDREEDRWEEGASPCQHCPIMKHRYDLNAG